MCSSGGATRPRSRSTACSSSSCPWSPTGSPAGSASSSFATSASPDSGTRPSSRPRRRAVADAAPIATAALDSLNAVVPAAIYLAVVRRVRRSGGAWPAQRTVLFLAGVTLAALATSSAADAAARRSLTWHMTVQMALLLLVAPAVVAGHPLALLRRIAGRRIPRPPGPAAFAFMHWLLIVAGVAFFAQVGSARLHPLALALYIASAMPTTDAIALWLLLDPRVVYAHYAGSGGLADQQAAGAIMF